MDLARRLRAVGGDVAIAYARFVRHGGDGLAAGIAFGTLLSIAPLLVVAVAVAGWVLGEGDARAEVLDLASHALGRRGAELVGGWVDQARTWSGTATAIGLAGFLFGAARWVAIVDAAFDVVFEAPRTNVSFAASIRGFFVTHATGVGVTLLAGVALVASVLLRALTGSALGLVAGTPLALVVAALRGGASFALLGLALAILYRALPPVRLSSRDVIEGAIATAILLEVTTWILARVVELVDVGAPYGAAGAIFVALIWLLIASSLFLLGAEITAERAERRRRGLEIVREKDAARTAPWLRPAHG